jgi:hypothetical protein
MKDLFSIAATAALVLGGAGASAAELPTFELMGFPITPHQVQVVGSGNVQERSPTARARARGHARLSASARGFSATPENG